MTHHHLGFKLTDCIQGNADHDDDRSTAQGDVDTHKLREQDGADGDDSQEDASHNSNLAYHAGNELRSGLTRTDARIVPLFFLRLLAISMGLYWIEI